MAMSTLWQEALPGTESQMGRLKSLEELVERRESKAEVPRDPAYRMMMSPPPPAGADRSSVEELVGTLRQGDCSLPVEVDPLEAAAEHYSEVLQQCACGLEGFSTHVAAALNCLQDIESRYQSVSSKAESLNGICETLLAEQAALEQRRRLLSGPMEFFDELERLGPLLGLQGGAPSATPGPAPAGGLLHRSNSSTNGLPSSLVRAQPGSDEFLEVLKRIDQAIEFFLQHPQYRDSTAYLLKMKQLQARGLGLVRTQILHHLDAASKAASSKKVFENLETSLIYSKFRAIATRVRDQVAVISERVTEQAPEHAELLEECKKSYTQKRWALLKPVIRAHLEGVAKAREGAALARTGAAVLTRICQLEAQLYDSFFGEAEPPVDGDEVAMTREQDSQLLSVRRRAGSHEFYASGELYQLQLGLCLLLRDLIRPLVIHEGDLENLCQLINVVKDEILEGQSPLRGVWGLALEVVLDKIAKDAQERLIYSAQKVMRVEIEMFRPTPADLDYPRKLEDYYALTKTHHRHSSSMASLSGSTSQGDREATTMDTVEEEPSDAPAPDASASAARPPGHSKATLSTTSEGSVASSSSLVHVPAGGGPVPIYASWFPTLHITLTLLSKIYRAVEIHVFQDMAQQALSACNESLMGAAKVLREAKGDLHADLFLVKHLLILREQLVPFDIEFAGVERRLDFKSTRGALTKFFVDTRKMFRMGADNALVHLAVESIPTVYENEVDSKRQLEESLKWACNSFIQHASDFLVAESLVSLLKMAQAFLPPADAPLHEQEARKEQLLAQPFMQVDRIQATLLAAHEALASSTPVLLKMMSLYLDNNATTKAILFKPVRLRVLNVASQLRDVLLRVMGGVEQALPTDLEGLFSGIRAALHRIEIDGRGGEVIPTTPMTNTWGGSGPPPPQAAEAGGGGAEG